MDQANHSLVFPLVSSVPQAVTPAFVEARVLIAGEIRKPGHCRPVPSPIHLKKDDSLAPEQVILGSAPAMEEAEALSALQAAVSAWQRGAGPWPTRRIEERIEAVEHFLKEMLTKREDVCRLLMWEVGKPWQDALLEFDRTVQYIRDTIDALKDLDRQGSQLQIRQGLIAQVRRAPLGVTLCMGPFNYPLNETFTTLIPALIMGNPVVVKLPRLGVLLWDPLLEAFRDSFPKGVVNIINGEGQKIVPPLLRTGQIDVLAFIGSAKAAHAIKSAHPRLNRLRGILGLDAKNPGLILADANIEEAVAECIKGTLTFNGQRCTALKILFVDRRIFATFRDAFCEAVERLPNGMPWEPNVKLTPLAEPGKAARLFAYVKDAVDKGAVVTNQGQGGGQSYLSAYHPAVVENVSREARLYTEEQFGPLVPLVPVSDADEFLSYVIDSNYGQQASLFGKDPAVLGRLIDVLANQVCRINLNTQCQRGPDIFPFTGRKDSAEGTLSIADALRSFSIRSMVAAPQNASGKAVVRSILDGDHSNFLSTDIIL